MLEVRIGLVHGATLANSVFISGILVLVVIEAMSLVERLTVIALRIAL